MGLKSWGTWSALQLGGVQGWADEQQHVGDMRLVALRLWSQACCSALLTMHSPQSAVRLCCGCCCSQTQSCLRTLPALHTVHTQCQANLLSCCLRPTHCCIHLTRPLSGPPAEVERGPTEWHPDLRHPRQCGHSDAVVLQHSAVNIHGRDGHTGHHPTCGFLRFRRAGVSCWVCRVGGCVCVSAWGQPWGGWRLAGLRAAVLAVLAPACVFPELVQGGWRAAGWQSPITPAPLLFKVDVQQRTLNSQAAVVPCAGDVVDPAVCVCVLCAARTTSTASFGMW